MASELEMTIEPVGSSVNVYVRNLRKNQSYNDHVTVWVYATPTATIPVPIGTRACWKGERQLTLGPYDSGGGGLDLGVVVCNPISNDCVCWPDTSERWLIAKLKDATPPPLWSQSETPYANFLACAPQAIGPGTSPADGLRDLGVHYMSVALPSSNPAGQPQLVQVEASFVPAAPSDPTFAALLADRALMSTMERRNLKFAHEAPSALYVQRGVESLSRPPRLSEPDDEPSECHCGSNGSSAEPALRRPLPSLRSGPLRNEEVRLYLAPSADTPSALRTYALAPRQVQQTILRAKRGSNTHAVAVVRIKHFVAPLETKPQDLPRVRRLSSSQVVALLPEFEPF